MQPVVYAVATLDSKGAELTFVADCLRRAGVAVTTVDVSTGGAPTVQPDISVATLLGEHRDLSQQPRSDAIGVISSALRDFLLCAASDGSLSGVIGIGGSGGTSLITHAMRALPIGLPKLMVSTVASGHTAPYVGCSDITMMYSVVDIAGLNSVSREILSNAAYAMAGMASRPAVTETSRKAVGLTMFGVTTACVTEVRRQLEARGYDCLVFHATGSGGRAMEHLVGSKLIKGVIDVTTTEVADEIAGGIMPAGEDRFDTLLSRRIPLVISLGALDMVNFGGLASVPPQYRKRQLLAHNADITLMRTTVAENRAAAEWIATKLRQAQAPLTLLIPEQGVSQLDAPGQPFHDPASDAALFNRLEDLLAGHELIRIVRLPYHINAPEFAAALVTEFVELAEQTV